MECTISLPSGRRFKFDYEPGSTKEDFEVVIEMMQLWFQHSPKTGDAGETANNDDSTPIPSVANA